MMRRLLRCWSLGTLLIVWASTAVAQSATSKHLRLIDRLDRPQDGYCFDILGTPGNMRLELPLFAHNCKSRLTPDSAVVFTRDGRIRFVGPNLCVTAMGVNGGALAGVPLLLRRCGRSAPFFNVDALQRFTLSANGSLSLRGTKLCVRVGAVSARTYSAADRWRSLYLDNCTTAPIALSRWAFVDAPR